MLSNRQSEVTVRRSVRLTNAGYYNHLGKPVISYKETATYKKRRFSPDGLRKSIAKKISMASGIIGANWAIGANGASGAIGAIGANWASGANRDSGASGASWGNEASGANRDSGGNRASGANGASWASGANRASWASGANRACWNGIIRWLFFMLLMCLGIVYFTLALSMNSNSLDSGPSASLFPSTKRDTALSTYEWMGERMRMLQDEVLRLKRVKEPPGDTMPNFALESQGALVLARLSSETYQCTGPTCFLLSLISLWRRPVDPSIVTQGGPIVVGRCWRFDGERGHLVIALSHPVTISHVTLGHISKTVSPTGSISNSPKMFAVYGMKTKEDEGTLLGTFLCDQDGESLQTFKLSDQEAGVFSHVKLQVESNWGNPDYTCVYNFRVYGTI
ncbi:sperm-associated antigen 4 protein-like isoform X6 [Sebastes umbrosus]|uniref:sperm-associated antigen 4 protein-like isoform X6 n=1 Tax=Sebastes umbrosus TaxID=72105 RepID=UPI00189D118B|nr:sperm-associated antigen 4 protein-like isoform X6 [Sebastes umbrosus]